MIAPLDWTLLQSFSAVAETGSLSAAARKLGQSQPTLGRHIRALEAALGVELFTRGPKGLIPTEAARGLIGPADQMRQAAARLRLAAEGQETGLAGTVRVTASTVVSHFILPPILAAIRRAHPEIQIELVPADSSENLLFREADIALRMYRPTQLDLVAAHVTDLEMGLYAATGFLDRVGRPRTVDELLKLDFVGFDANDTIIRFMREAGLEVGRGFFGVRCDDQAAYWQLVRAGCGIGGMQAAIGDDEPGVERVLSKMDLPTLPVWLAAPAALRHSPRIRLVWDRLAAGLRRL
ncbi:LysR family transcriptional regulator [Antarcticimicrobium luteum]|uniref:LysR family transcriptional regulator n=1 Tax=Antarcticimicrobium luteum TaxID=2547397 RepID=A0A4R5UXF9_9RHOB|nr:LysR family transcriptional regulator [Antarcticimicrobium luteum]TDK43982.1 LysR family transcriptional regulator [Antarcticimicrobium luteum]